MLMMFLLRFLGYTVRWVVDRDNHVSSNSKGFRTVCVVVVVVVVVVGGGDNSSLSHKLLICSLTYPYFLQWPGRIFSQPFNMYT